MNNKGQALVEFILIMPVLLFLLFTVIDFGVIFNAKSKLENTSTDIVTMIKNEENIDNIRNIYNQISINIKEEGKYKTIILEENVDLITPGLNRVLDDPYLIKVERIIYNE